MGMSPPGISNCVSGRSRYNSFPKVSRLSLSDPIPLNQLIAAQVPIGDDAPDLITITTLGLNLTGSFGSFTFREFQLITEPLPGGNKAVAWAFFTVSRPTGE